MRAGSTQVATAQRVAVITTRLPVTTDQCVSSCLITDPWPQEIMVGIAGDAFLGVILNT